MNNCENNEYLNLINMGKNLRLPLIIRLDIIMTEILRYMGV